MVLTVTAIYRRPVLAPMQFIPAPKAIELDPVHGWSAWDSAVLEMDAMGAYADREGMRGVPQQTQETPA